MSKSRDNVFNHKILSKDEIKERIGRSPDLSDAMMMRMYFEINKSVLPTKQKKRAPQYTFNRITGEKILIQ